MNTKFLQIRLGVFVALLTLCGVAPKPREFPADFYGEHDDETIAKHAALEGKRMPTLDVTEWTNGTVTPAAMKGKVVVVAFWGTWCEVCLGEIPRNQTLIKTYKDRGLLLFGVCSSSHGQEKMAEVVKEKGIDYPTAKDPKRRTQAAWAVSYFPTYGILDRKGIVRAVGITPEHVEEVVKKLLDEK